MQVLQRPDDLETSSGNPSLQSIVGSDTNPSVHACSVDTSYATPTSPRYMRTSRREPHIHAARSAAAAAGAMRIYVYVCMPARARDARACAPRLPLGYSSRQIKSLARSLAS
jgi:hypothetical protein